ncbi:MAG TPA: glycosyltransferase [Patescibacteria group bacterium]|nr:glycosyltransferase [Patescibacteria group bacterium]
MKELYLANMWPQIVTKKGIELLEQNGFNATGNWLNGNNDHNHADRIILPYADFGKPVLIPESDSELWKKTISYILFPDSLVGWDFKKNHYRYQRDKGAELILQKSQKRLSHSNYSSELARVTYGVDNLTIPLGIDSDTIRSVEVEQHAGLKVLWNHMWRSDKGTAEAFDIIAKLAPKYSQVEFWVGQTNTWDIRDSKLFTEKCFEKLKLLQKMDNVKFFNRLRNQKEYWAWTSQVDISFSTAFQEGFGLSMMEQEAAGIACVVPNAEAYPELHGGCLIIDREKLAEGLELLIQNPIKRKSISQSCRENASKYDTSVWVEKIIRQLD